MEVSQFTYFQQVGGHDCRPVSGELTYGLERLAMYVLGVAHVMEMPFNDPPAPIPLTYGDVFRQTEEEYSRHNFDAADTDRLLRHFEDAETECRRLLDGRGHRPPDRQAHRHGAPGLRPVHQGRHLFNLLDARGVISVTERQAYIGRVRALAKLCADAFVRTEAGGPRRGRGGVNAARVVIVAHPRSPPLVAGVGMYWLQVYAFYEELSPEEAGPVTLVGAGRRGRGASPSRTSAPSTATPRPSATAPASRPPSRWTPSPRRFEPYADARRRSTRPAGSTASTPRRSAPRWSAGEARAFLAVQDVRYGIDRVVAVFPDGRGFAWHQINPCGERRLRRRARARGLPPVPERPNRCPTS